MATFHFQTSTVDLQTATYVADSFTVIWPLDDTSTSYLVGTIVTIHDTTTLVILNPGGGTPGAPVTRQSTTVKKFTFFNVFDCLNEPDQDLINGVAEL